MPTLEQYIDDLEKRQNRQQMLESNLGEAANTNPDEFANMVKLSRAAQLPVDAVPEYQDIAKQAQLIRNVNAPTMFDRAPKTSNFLLDPTKAKIVGDDIDNFKATEGTFGKMKTIASTIGGIIQSGALSSSAGIVGVARAPIEMINEIAGGILPEKPFTPLTNWLAEYQRSITQKSQAVLPKAEGVLEKGLVSGGVSLTQNVLNMPLLFAGPAGQEAYLAGLVAPEIGRAHV